MNKLMQVSAVVDDHACIPQLFVAKTFWQRCRGLLARPVLSPEQGLLIPSCNSVHMFGMAYALDIVYLNASQQVVKVVRNLKPWQVSACRKAHAVIELAAGMSQQLHIHPGCTIHWSQP